MKTSPFKNASALALGLAIVGLVAFAAPHANSDPAPATPAAPAADTKPAADAKAVDPTSFLSAPIKEGIVLDGSLDDWKDIPFTTVNVKNAIFDTEDGTQKAVATSDDDLSYKFAVCHDKKAFYVAVEVTDDVVKTDSTTAKGKQERAWDDDAIEVFIDGNHNKAPNARAYDKSEMKYGGEFSLVINGAAASRFSSSPNKFGDPEFWEGATNWEQVQKGEKKLRYEYRITFKAMGGEVKPGSQIGFTIAAQDDDDGGSRDHSMYWKGISPSAWRDEAGWGTVTLEK
jgi:hypothetical protein